MSSHLFPWLFPMKAFFAFCIIVLVALSGCLDDESAPDGPETDGTETEPSDGGEQDDQNVTGEKTGLRLSELTCDFLYPDNTTQVPCENTFDELEIQQTDVPRTSDTLTWVCVEQSDEQDWEYSVHWDPFEERFGLYYEFPDVDRPINGVLYKDDESVGAVWYNGENTGFVHLPDVGQSDPPEMVSKMSIIFYVHDYVSETPELDGGAIQALWSYHDGTPYPLQVVNTDSDSYYFHNVTAKELGADAYTYHIESGIVDGEDFTINVQSKELKRIQISWNPRPFFCAL